MNRKEGIVMGIVVLATFITGVFAIPEQQLLNVFVTNLENETRVVFSESFTVPANTTFQSRLQFGATTVDVSQFRQARVRAEVLYTGDVFSIGVLHLAVHTAFPVSPPGTYDLGESFDNVGAGTDCASGVCVSHAMLDAIALDTPELRVFFSFDAFEDITVTAKVVVFLQR